MSETLLKSALEKIVFFECRIDQLTADLKRAEEELELLRQEARDAAAREAALRKSLAETSARESEAVRQRDAARRRAELLSAERERFLGRLIEIEQIRKAGGDADDSCGDVDLASFMAELRSEVMRLTAENRTLRTALEQSNRESRENSESGDSGVQPPSPAAQTPPPTPTPTAEPAPTAEVSGQRKPTVPPPNTGSQMALPLAAAPRGRRPIREMTAAFRTPEEAAESLRKTGRLGLTDEDRSLLQSSIERRSASDRERPLLGRDIGDLQSGDASTRRRAAERLRTSAPAESLPMLAAALNAESDDDAAKALIAAIAETGSEHSLPLILPSLSSGSLTVRLAALEAAARLGGSECVLSAMDDPSPLVRRRAVVLASASGDRRAVLTRAVRDADVSVRKVAALDLGASADDAALADALTEALDDADASVREAAAKSLSAAAGPEILNAVRLDPSIRRREIRRIVAALHPVSQTNSSAPFMVSGSIDRRLGSIQRTLTAIAQGRRSVTPAPAAAVQPSAPPAMPTTQVTPVPAGIPRPEKEVPAAAAAPEVTSAEKPPADEVSGEALNSAIISRVYGALRGQTAEGLAKALRLGADTIRPAVEKLVQEGRIVRRGTRYFVP